MFCSWWKQTRAAGFAALSSVIPAGAPPPPPRCVLQPWQGLKWTDHCPPHLLWRFCPSFPCILLQLSHWQDQSFCSRSYTSSVQLQGERKQGETRVVISHSSTFPLQMSNKRRRKEKNLKMTCSHCSNKKQLLKSVTQPKSIMLVKKIYKPRIMSLKTQASFKLKYKLFWNRIPSIQTDNPKCDNITTVLNL